VTVTGSSTVEPISALVAEQFSSLHDGAVAVTVDGPGTSDGFTAFCAGEADVNDASRPISEREIAACTENGTDYVELAVAIDGLSVITSPDNPVECLSFADLYALVGAEAEGVDNWADSRALAAELGSTTAFPNQRLIVTAPGEESGTFDSFYELALKSITEDRVEAGLAPLDANGDPVKVRADYQSSPNDNVIVQGAAGDQGTLGWVGFAYADESRDRVKLLAVDAAGDGTCVAPDATTIADGSYPLSRTLYVYVNTATAAENPALAAFVDFYLSDEGIANVEGADYVALAPDQLASTRRAWESA
jgi:phosphate transport system substrate-binding protein